MEAVNIIRGTCLPLNRSDVDTDQIIPSDWLKRVERTGFERGLFSEWRKDPNFELNQEIYSGAEILVAGPNFGTGSSREHAVWALQQYGFKAVVSSKFGEIFKNNSTKCGLVPVEASVEFVENLFDVIGKDSDTKVLIDVTSLRVGIMGAGDSDSTIAEGFHLDPATQERFINGLDDIDLTLRNAEQIETFEKNRPRWLSRSASKA